MQVISKAVEVKGEIDKNHKLLLDEPLSSIPPGKVRIILMLENETDIKEQEWLLSAAKNSAFEFLKDLNEDIYSNSDGKPFND
ncbi:MAG: hypothetical protein U9R23_06505 [Candidatus Cloacimonadota bacterium]|nr:hypothetical protein [Candidatus Cloacimonadota bacterium]